MTRTSIIRPLFEKELAACLRQLVALIERMPNAAAILTPPAEGARLVAEAKALLRVVERGP